MLGDRRTRQTSHTRPRKRVRLGSAKERPAVSENAICEDPLGKMPRAVGRLRPNVRFHSLHTSKKYSDRYLIHVYTHTHTRIQTITGSSINKRAPIYCQSGVNERVTKHSHIDSNPPHKYTTSAPRHYHLQSLPKRCANSWENNRQARRTNKD